MDTWDDMTFQTDGQTTSLQVIPQEQDQTPRLRPIYDAAGESFFEDFSEDGQNKS
jgi:hypothetical protein